MDETSTNNSLIFCSVIVPLALLRYLAYFGERDECLFKKLYHFFPSLLFTIEASKSALSTSFSTEIRSPSLSIGNHIFAQPNKQLTISSSEHSGPNYLFLKLNQVLCVYSL